MSYYLKNPSGVIVEVDDKAMFKKFLSLPGFDVATDEEKEAFLAQRKIASSTPETNPEVLFIQYACPRPNSDGYGQSHAHTRDALLKYGVKLEETYKGQKIGLAMGYPEMINRLKTPIKVLYTMFESTKIPDEWIPDMEKADLIITPTKFCQNVFKEAGIDSVVVPMGYDEHTFQYEAKDPDKKKFTFLMYDAFNHRKGWDLVFKAFNNEFKSEDAELILKTTRTRLPFPILRSEYPNIKTIKDAMSHHELAELMHSVDCFVLPSRGEGFGHPPLEALATGTPAIIPNAHGFSEYFTREYFLEVKIKKETPAIYERYKGQNVGYMFESDLKSLQDQMRFAYEHRAFVFDMAKRGAVWAKKNWSYDQMGIKLSNVLRDVAEENTTVVVKDIDRSSKRHSIIMLTYNALHYTKKAIKAIKDNSEGYELIVIDNNSSDGTQEWLKKQDGIDHLILNKENLGVAEGRNQGIRLAKGEIITYLDNDTEVKPGWQKMVLAEFDDPMVGIVGRGGQQVPFLKPVKFVDPPKDEGRAFCDVVPGYCFSFRKDLVGVIGENYSGFPNGKFWHEDLDFCLRAQMAGYKILSNDNIQLDHHEHKSVGDDVSNEQTVQLVEGFYENAAHIQERLVSCNIVNVYREFRGFDHIASYDRLVHGMSEGLRKQGMVVLRKDTMHESNPSFDLCKGFDIINNGKRYVLLHQENDRCPRSWQKNMKHVDYAFAVSPHVVEATKDEPYADKIINVSPNGFNPDIYKIDGEILDDFHPGKFIFLFVGATQPRKNADNLIKWYQETFTDEDDVVLVIKDGGYGQKVHTQRVIAQYNRNNSPEIDYVFDEWTDEYLASVYRTVARRGAYIHPHRAECFGLPIIEAIACGCRVGTTGWGGVVYNVKNLTYKNSPQTVTLFGYDLADSLFHNHPGEPYYADDEAPKWAEPHAAEVKKFMIDMYSKQGYNEEKARKASEIITKRFDYNKRAEAIRKELCKN